jgi:uncharacterized protein involved in exopolysaccharide biosynthesis
MEAPAKDLYDYLALLRRRKTVILAVGLSLLVASAALAFLLPAVYRSTATILIEFHPISCGRPSRPMPINGLRLSNSKY